MILCAFGHDLDLDLPLEERDRDREADDFLLPLDLPRLREGVLREERDLDREADVLREERERDLNA